MRDRTRNIPLGKLKVINRTVGVSQLKAGAKLGMIRADMYSAEAIL